MALCSSKTLSKSPPSFASLDIRAVQALTSPPIISAASLLSLASSFAVVLGIDFSARISFTFTRDIALMSFAVSAELRTERAADRIACSPPSCNFLNILTVGWLRSGAPSSPSGGLPPEPSSPSNGFLIPPLEREPVVKASLSDILAISSALSCRRLSRSSFLPFAGSP